METSETKINIPINYKIYTKISSIILVKILVMINNFFSFLSLKKTKRFWGIVYDSISKQPLDPVIVKLLYSDGREIESGVTDIMGRYGFLASPGKFKIYAKKTNYTFPSKRVMGDRDGIYENIYHGEFFTLKEDAEVVAPNIPMDPVGFDWNQQAKKKLDQSYPFFRLFVKKLASIFFWFFLILVLLGIWAYYPKVPTTHFVAVVVYLFLFVVAKFLPDAKLYGQVQIKVNLPDTQYVYLELHNPQFPAVSFGKTMVQEDGKFLLRANPGKYLLTVSKVNALKEKILLGSLNIKIGSEGVFQNTLVIR